MKPQPAHSIAPMLGRYVSVTLTPECPRAFLTATQLTTINQPKLVPLTVNVTVTPLPSFAVTVIVAEKLPGAIESLTDISPVLLTVTSPPPPLSDHVTDLLVALEGDTEAVN